MDDQRGGIEAGATKSAIKQKLVETKQRWADRPGFAGWGVPICLLKAGDTA
jgi:hypothetical protein